MRTLHVAVGVLQDPQSRILITQRRVGTPGAGQWEFPGGKREPGESIYATLKRELSEELGVVVREARPMLRFHYDYPDRRVLLDTWKVLHWSGQARGCEGQKLHWCEPKRLHEYDLLAASKPIVGAIRLPSAYAITPDPDVDDAKFYAAADAAAAAGVRLMRLRGWQLDDEAYESVALRLKKHLDAHATQLILDRTPEMVTRVGAAGLHIPGHRLDALAARPVGANKWFAASCHDREQLLHAANIGADFATLSPLKPKPGYAQSLGWQGFAAARGDIALPIYALGGMTLADLRAAWQHGAHGIAAIRSLWPPAQGESP